jgi:hypothetical protein
LLTALLRQVLHVPELPELPELLLLLPLHLPE